MFKKLQILLYFTLIFIIASLQQSWAAIDVNKTFAPSTVYPREDTTLTIILQNSALTPVNNVNFTDIFPDNTFVSDLPNISNTCSGIITHSNSVSGGLVSLSGGIIPQGDGTNPGICSISLSVYAFTAGSYINTIEVGSVTGETGGVVESNTQISQGTLVAVIEDIGVDQQMRIGYLTGAISNVLNGNEVGFQKIIFSNPNPVDLTNASYSLNIPAGFNILTDELSTTCGNGTIEVSGDVVTFSAGTIPAQLGGINGECEVVIKVQSSRDITLPYNRTRPTITFPAFELQTNEGATNSLASFVRYDNRSGVYIDRFYPDGATQNHSIDINNTDTTRIRLYIRQYNTQDISDFGISDTLPVGINIISIESNSCGGSVSGVGTNTLNLTGSTFLSGVNENQAGAQFTICDVYYTVQVDSTGVFTTDISAGDFSGYQYNSDVSSLTVTGNVFELGMSFDRNIIYQGDTNRLTYTLTNRSKTRSITNIDIINDLSTMGRDSGLGTADSEPIFKVSNIFIQPTTNCISGTIIAPIGSSSIELQDFELAPDTTCFVNVEIIVDTDAVSPGLNYNGDFRNYNTIPVGGVTYDIGDGVETFATQVEASIRTYRAVNLNKSWTPEKVGPSGISRLMLRITKRSFDNNDLYNISLLDNLPSGFEVAANPQVQNGCGGDFSADMGSNSVSLSGGYLRVNSTSAYCSIYVNIKAKNLTPPNLSETHTNIIPGDTHGSPVIYFSADDGNGNPYENVQYGTSATITIESIDLSVNTSFLQSNINGGSVSRVRTTLSNLDPNSIALTGVSLVDFLPSGVQLYGDINPVFSDVNGDITENCNGASFVGLPGDTSITLQDGNIGANTLCIFEYNVTALVGGNHINTIDIGDILTNEGITNASSAASTLTVGRQVNVGKGFSPSIIEVGGSSTMNIMIYNSQSSGNDEIGTNIENGDPQPALRDFIPNGITIIDVPTTDCVGGVVSTGSLNGQDYIDLNGGIFSAESVCQITANIRIDSAGLYSDTVLRDTLFTVSGSQNPDEARANIRVIHKPMITTSFSPNFIPSGGISTITYTLDNSINSTELLPSGMSRVQFLNTFSEMEIASPLTVGGSCQGVEYNAVIGGNSFEVTNAKIPAGGSCNITIGVTSSSYGFLNNQTTGINTTETQTTGDSSNIATLTVLEPATITKSFFPTTVSTGQPTRLTFTLTNPNTLNSVGNIRFYDILPVGMQLAPNPNISDTCAGSVTVLDFNSATLAAPATRGIDIQGSGTIPASSSCTIALDIVSTLGGNLVNTSSPLTTYAGTSSSGATATLISLVNTPPVITLIGSGSLIVGVGSTYTDAGAIATDNQDGDITSRITASGSVNTSMIGSYTIEYNVTDLGAMSAIPVTRNITVVDTIAPTISLTGSGTIALEVGTPYTELGAICSDNYDVNCVVVTSGTVDISTPGIYTIIYTATDISGNIETITRQVEVVSMGIPTISLIGSGTITLEVGSTYSDPGVLASDNEDGNLTSSITSSGSVDTNMLGSYTISYNVVDSNGNQATQVTRIVNIVDTQAPVISNPNLSYYLIDQQASIDLQSLSCSDNYDVSCTISQTGSIDNTVPGAYPITYTATDISGNTTELTIVVEVKSGFGTSGGRSYSCRDESASNYSTSGFSDQSLCEYNTGEEPENKEEVLQNQNNEIKAEQKSDNIIEDIDEIIISEKQSEKKQETGEIIEKIAENNVVYTLGNDFASCTIIDWINDENYLYNNSGVFIDENTARFKDKILKFQDIGIVDGYEDGSFRPEKLMTRAEFLKVALISHCYEYRDLVGDTSYKDIMLGGWQAKVVQKAEDIGMINGYEDGSFRPNNFISKAEAIKILMKISMIYANNPEQITYNDIEVSWHIPYIETGETLGLFDAEKDGYTFYPYSYVERQDMVDLIERLASFYR